MYPGPPDASVEYCRTNILPQSVRWNETSYVSSTVGGSAIRSPFPVDELSRPRVEGFQGLRVGDLYGFGQPLTLYGDLVDRTLSGNRRRQCEPSHEHYGYGESCVGYEG